MKSLCSWVLVAALAALFVSTPAKAEDTARATGASPVAPPLPYAPYVDSAVSLELTGVEPMTITVYSADQNEDTPLFKCRTPCRVRIYPGKYRFHVRGGPAKIESDTVADVDHSTRLQFSLPNQSDKSGALTMAITGTAFIPVGLVVAFASAMANACWDCGNDRSRRDTSTPAGVYLGLGMVAAGAIMTPVGWSSFARNRKPHYESAELGVARKSHEQPARPIPPRIGFGVAPTKGGASAGIWGSF